MKANFTPSYNQNRKSLHKIVPLDTPFTISIAPATTCNFKCKYCVHSLSRQELDTRKFHPAVMTWDLFLKVAGQLQAFSQKIKQITLTGNGEPLCNSRLPDMVAYIKNLAVAEAVTVTTNGALLNRDNINALIDAGLDRIFFSIQGLSAEKYLDICGVKLNFDEFLNNIHYFYTNKSDCKIHIKIVNIALDSGDDSKFLDMFGGMCDEIFIDNIVPVFDGVDYNTMIDSNSPCGRYGGSNAQIMACPQSFYSLYIWPDGSIYPCCCDSAPIMMGNVNSTNIFEAWNSAIRRDFLAMQLAKTRMANPVCKICNRPDNISCDTDMLYEYASEILKRL